MEEVPRVRKELGLSAAGDAHLADRRHAGDPQRAHGPLQDGHQGDQGLRAGLLRPSAGADRPRGAEAHHRRRDAHHRAPRRHRWSRSCPSAGPSWTNWASSTATRTSCPTPCSRRWPWSSSPGATGRSAPRRSWPRWSRPWPDCSAWTRKRRCAPQPAEAAAASRPRGGRTAALRRSRRLRLPPGPRPAGRELVGARAVAWRY